MEVVRTPVTVDVHREKDLENLGFRAEVTSMSTGQVVVVMMSGHDLDDLCRLARDGDGHVCEVTYEDLMAAGEIAYKEGRTAVRDELKALSGNG